MSESDGIVVRLRKRAAEVIDGGDGNVVWAALLTDAADEIEHLRALAGKVSRGYSFREIKPSPASEPKPDPTA